MSAAQIGASLLAEVEEVSLDELFTYLRYGTGFQTYPDVGLAEIDQLLELFHPQLELLPLSENASFAVSGNGSSEDGQDEQPSFTKQMFLRMSTRPKPALIELASTSADSESTDLCYLLTANTIINTPYGGKGRCVVWLDTSIRFSVSRLFQICLKQLNIMNEGLTQSECEYEAIQALMHVHVFSVQSSNQLFSTLENLVDYLLQTDRQAERGLDQPIALPKHCSSHRKCSIIVLDSATAFHWQDRFDAEIARLETQMTTMASTRIKATEPTTSSIINMLRDIQDILGCTVVYTTNHDATKVSARAAGKQRPQASNHQTPTPVLQEGFPQEASRSQPHPQPPPPPETPSLPALSQWTNQATLSLTLTPIMTPPFSTQHMSLQDCQRDSQARQEIVQRHRVAVNLNETWLNRVFTIGHRESRTGKNTENFHRQEEEIKKQIAKLKDQKSSRKTSQHGDKKGGKNEEKEEEEEAESGPIFIMRCQKDGVEIEM